MHQDQEDGWKVHDLAREVGEITQQKADCGFGSGGHRCNCLHNTEKKYSIEKKRKNP